MTLGSPQVALPGEEALGQISVPLETMGSGSLIRTSLVLIDSAHLEEIGVLSPAIGHCLLFSFIPFMNTDLL